MAFVGWTAHRKSSFQPGYCPHPGWRGALTAVRNEKVFQVIVLYSHPVPPACPEMWSLYFTLQFTPTIPNLSLSERRLMTGKAWPCFRLGGFEELGS